MSDHQHLLALLDSEDRRIVLQAGELASVRGFSAYLVGGVVRDLLLGTVSPDIDILIAGDAIVVAQDLARSRDGEVVRHHAFGTATVTLADGRRIDFAMARSERYADPGALPQVEAGTLEDDLARRDFTINTIALDIAPETMGQLHDPFDGREDLDAGLIRTLHEQSFSDDPTRLLRALRFALRLDYAIEASTADGIRGAAAGDYLADISGDRMRRELDKLLSEQPVNGIAALEEWGLLAALHTGLRNDPAAFAAVESVDARDPELPWVVMSIAAQELAPQERWDLARRLTLPNAAQQILVDSGEPWRRALEQLQEAGGGVSRSSVAAILDGLDPHAVAVGLAVGPPEAARAQVERYLREDRYVSPVLDGDDVLALGCPEGPAVGAVLRGLRAARIDGDVSDVDGERELALRLIEATDA